MKQAISFLVMLHASIACQPIQKEIPEAPVDKSSKRYITISNNITSQMLGYKFANTIYTPDSFFIKANGLSIAPGKSASIPITKNTLIIRYDYSFARGWYTGAKETIFALNSAQEEYCLTFSWQDQWRIIMQGAQAQDAKARKYHKM